MFRFIAFLIITVSAFPQKQRRPHMDGRVVGGTPANIDEFPYQASLEAFGQHICGGSILNQIFILTAGHCTMGLKAENLNIRVGSSIKERGGALFAVKNIYLHPHFKIETLDYDIAVLLLNDFLTFSSSIAPIGLVSIHAEIAPETQFYVTGWGAMHENGISSQQLQVVEIPFVEKKDCQAAYKDVLVSDRMICAGTKYGGKDACQGDSGGPLVAEALLVGIVSWGYGCARPDFPGVYSNVAELRDFIKNITSL